MSNVLRDNLLRSRATQQLMQTLQAMFRQQAIYVAGRISLGTDDPLEGGVPELVDWVEPIANAASPMLLKLAQAGVLETQARLARRGIATGGIITGRAADDVRRYTVPTGQAFGATSDNVLTAKNQGSRHQQDDRDHQPAVRTKAGPVHRQPEYGGGAATQVVKSLHDMRSRFDIFNPRVVDAVNVATFTFCRETMETARGDLRTALSDLRKLLRGGMQRGEALRLLAKRVHEIFADPARAFRIAVTEASRAQHLGQLMAAKESGVVHKKSWLASPDACDLCLALMEKGPIPLDEPFYIEPKGGPYAIIHAPPAHPHDFCSMNEEID